jgi:hypothetical protein
MLFRAQGQRLRHAWLFAVIPPIIMTVVTCSSDPPKAQPLVDSGSEQGVLAGGVCPDASPEAGSSCNVPEGTTCAFGTCGTGIAQCSLGIWRFGGNPPPPPACPTEFPFSGAACPRCFPVSLVCSFGQCDGPDATANVTYASCPNGAWSIDASVCPIQDAGADVQHDADADSD